MNERQLHPPTPLQYNPLGSPTELPPNAKLTNRPELWDERSRPVSERLAREECERNEHSSPFG